MAERDRSVAEATATVAIRIEPHAFEVGTFTLSVVDGADPITFESRGSQSTAGTHATNDFVLADPAVSRFHFEVRVDDATGSVRIRDMSSKNGTFVDGVRVFDACLRDGNVIRVGTTSLVFSVGGGRRRVRLSREESFGGLVGRSVAARTLFARLEKASASDATVLLLGETGTGKEEAAAAIHDRSRRASRPFVVADLAAMPTNLIESELFGHERGAFTGADRRRVGAFEQANGGTIFLDEVGELPIDFQPKLLRVLEARTVRRIGGNEPIPIDVRIVAATHRDLRSFVNTGTFREDLYYRLAVLRVPMPALRERADDIELIAERLLRGIGAPSERIAQLLTPEFVDRLRAGTWPGNVRQLRNYLEQVLVFDEVEVDGRDGDPAAAGEGVVDSRVPYAEARRRALDGFEAEYVRGLLELHDYNVTVAARSAGVARGYLHRIIRRHGLVRR